MKKTLSTLALSLFALVGVAQAADITVENAAGKQVVPQNPQRVIVLDFGAADTLRALGVQDKIVGFPQSGKIPSYLSEFADKKYKNVGDLKEQSLEQINELNPDLIIASKRQEKMIDKFKEIAPVFNVENDYNNYYPSFQQNVTALGQIFGKENVAKEKLSALESKVDQVAKDAKGKTALLVLVNESKISAFGDGSRYQAGNVSNIRINNIIECASKDYSINISLVGQDIRINRYMKLDTRAKTKGALNISSSAAPHVTTSNIVE